MKELAIPVPSEDNNPAEMARIWITGKDGKSHIILNYGVFGEKELKVWGSLAADLIAHAVRAATLEGTIHSDVELFAMVEAGLRERLSDNPTRTGTFTERTLQ